MYELPGGRQTECNRHRHAATRQFGYQITGIRCVALGRSRCDTDYAVLIEEIIERQPELRLGKSIFTFDRVIQIKVRDFKWINSNGLVVSAIIIPHV